MSPSPPIEQTAGLDGSRICEYSESLLGTEKLARSGSHYSESRGLSTDLAGILAPLWSVPFLTIIALMVLFGAAQAQQDPDKPLVVGSEEDYPPFAIGKTGGAAGGFTVDLWKVVAEESGLKYAIRVRPFRQLLEEFKAGKIDVMINLAQSEERRTSADFSVPHVVVHGAVFVRKGESGIRSEADLAGKSIIVLNSDLAHDYAISKGWKQQLVPVDTAADGLKLLASGQHDAMLLSKLAGMQTLLKLKIHNVTALDAKAGFSQRFSFSVQKGNAELLEKINEGLAVAKANGTYDALYEKWFGVFEASEVNFRQLLKYLGPIAAAFAIFLGLLLVKQHERKKGVDALRSSNESLELRTAELRRTVDRLKDEISERERVELALSESEGRYRTIVEAAHEGIWVLDANGCTTFVNRRMSDLLGYAPEELIGRKLVAFMDGESREQALLTLERLAEGVAEDHEFRFLRRDASVLWAIVCASPMHDDKGAYIGTLGMILDITERRRAEDLLRANNDMLEGVTRVQQQFLIEADSRRWFDRVLALLLETTASECGFIAEILTQPRGQPYLKLLAMTNISWNDENDALHQRNAQTALEFHNLNSLFGVVVTARQTLISNDPANDPLRGELPGGNPPLRAFLGIPFFHGDELTGMVGLANRAGGYDEQLAQRLGPLLATCSSMVHAYRLETQRRKSDEALEFMATHDELTRLPNRAMLLERLGRLIEASRRDHVSFALLFADLDNFKVVNDSLGHSTGDELLKIVAKRLVQTVREHDTVARFGGDEFIIILASIDTETLKHAMDRIVEVIAQPVRIGDHEIHTSASIGVSLFPQDADEAERLLQNADSAMYLAKEKGKRTAYFFSARVREEAQDRLALESELRAAIKNCDIDLAYQPQIDLRSGTMVGVEALVRWNHPRRGNVASSSVILLAEKAGLMNELGHYVFDMALKQMARWKGENKRIPRLAVNLSAIQLRDTGLIARMNGLLQKHNVLPNEVTLEITESALIIDPYVAEKRLHELKETGVRISLDDFGTGYSSLSFLRQFPIDELKIDKSFVAGIDTSSEDRVIAQTVLAMAHSLDRAVVAEGIETFSHLQTLLTLGCRIGQGFYFSKPCAPEQVADSYPQLLAL